MDPSRMIIGLILIFSSALGMWCLISDIERKYKNEILRRSSINEKQ
jgi:hypothetical protein